MNNSPSPAPTFIREVPAPHAAAVRILWSIGDELFITSESLGDELEVMVFPAHSNGMIADLDEVAVLRGSLDHAAAIARAA